MERKEIIIENKIWDKLKEEVLRIRTKNPEFSTGKIISELIIRFKNEKIKVREGIKSKEVKGRKFDLDNEALEIYNNLGRGTKTYIVNGILRSWFKEKGISI